MKIRAEMHVNGEDRKVLLVAKENETWEHLTLKLAAYILLWDHRPVPDPGMNNPALLGQEFRPDILGVDFAGNIALWAEVGRTALHKISKIAKRYREARIFLLKARPQEAKKLRRDLQEQEVPNQERIEICSFADGGYVAWESCLDESTHVTGEASDRELNLVANGQICMARLEKF
ncbi:MAG: YaeQ family protein [Elusimicrobia bacterium]|nr:YaeQ family protein [Elusimicrobiota bacterium]